MAGVNWFEERCIKQRERGVKSIMTRVFLGIFIPTLTVINSRREERSFPSAFHIDSPVWSDSSNLFFPFFSRPPSPLSLLVHPAYVPIKSFARLGHAIPRFRSLSSQFALSLPFFVTVRCTVTARDELVQFAPRSNVFFPFVRISDA